MRSDRTRPASPNSPIGITTTSRRPRANSQMRTLSETEWHCAAILIACPPARSSRRIIPVRLRGVRAKIVIRHHHPRGRKRARKFTPGNMLRRFDFNIAPVAARAGRLRQDLDLLFPAALKQPSPFFPPARGNQHGARAFAAEPGQEIFPLLRAAKIIQAQFQRARLAQAQTDLRPHLSAPFQRRRRRTRDLFRRDPSSALHPQKLNFRLLSRG